MKYCCRCHIAKDLSEFCKDKRRQDGCADCCRSCNSIGRTIKYAKKHPHKLRRDELTNVICSCCKQEKSKNEFRLQGRYLSSLCKNCVSKRNLKYQMEHHSERLAAVKKRRKYKASYVRDLKSRACVDCNKIYPPWCMDWDHTDFKINNISALVNNSSIARINDELDKTELVCVGCHRIRTFNRKDHLKSHDTYDFRSPHFGTEPILNPLEPSKNCSRCGKLRNMSFYRKTGRYYRSLCRICIRNDSALTRSRYRDAHILKRKERRHHLKDIVNAIKSGPCQICGEKFDPILMDMDHIDTLQKEIDISAAVQAEWAIDRLMKELEKCRLLCCWCYRKVSYQQALDSGLAYDWSMTG